MPPPPPRRRFQIHLSTAIVLMFVAGGLIWANVRLRRTAEWESLARDSHHFLGVVTVDALFEYGWPATAYSAGHAVFYEPRIHFIGVFINTLAAFLILFVGWFMFEWIIRRHAARKDF